MIDEKQQDLQKKEELLSDAEKERKREEINTEVRALQVFVNDVRQELGA
ncbi:MAG: hypothetical protein HOK36_03820, partial [Rhodospirillales bacterium]|nr:hypothetical protein [Rhodospirillales bacterium]